jgi:hypothetical protein
MLFKSIPNHPNYEASDTGIIRNKTTKRHLKGKIDMYGYHAVVIKNVYNKKKYPTVHRLVALTFIDNINNYPQVNHIDGNKLNNNIENLEWCTAQHNVQHAYATGLAHGQQGESNGMYGKKHTKEALDKISNHSTGTNNPACKLTEEQVREIQESALRTDLPRGYWANKAREFGISKGHISNVKDKRAWKCS